MHESCFLQMSALKLGTECGISTVPSQGASVSGSGCPFPCAAHEFLTICHLLNTALIRPPQRSIGVSLPPYLAVSMLEAAVHHSAGPCHHFHCCQRTKPNLDFVVAVMQLSFNGPAVAIPVPHWVSTNGSTDFSRPSTSTRPRHGRASKRIPSPIPDVDQIFSRHKQIAGQDQAIKRGKGAGEKDPSVV